MAIRLVSFHGDDDFPIVSINQPIVVAQDGLDCPTHAICFPLFEMLQLLSISDDGLVFSLENHKYTPVSDEMNAFCIFRTVRHVASIRFSTWKVSTLTNESYSLV